MDSRLQDAKLIFSDAFVGDATDVIRALKHLIEYADELVATQVDPVTTHRLSATRVDDI